MFDPDARNAGERSFRDFFRLPPTKENRRQSVDPACCLCWRTSWPRHAPNLRSYRRSPWSFSAGG